VTRAIAYLREHPGEYETLVIDPVTVLYETLQDAAQSSAPAGISGTTRTPTSRCSTGSGSSARTRR
jgi:hypothetical protein